MNHADTDDAASITICDMSGDCCSTPLNNPDINDREKGRVDTYSGPDDLGQCFNFVMGKGDLSVTLEKERSDGWFVEWTEIKLAGGMSFNCAFNIWLDNDNGHSRSETVQCLKTM